MTKTALRKTVGRGKFVARDLAAAQGIQPVSARQKLDRLVEAGTVEEVGTRKHTDAEGKFTRGRPAKVYKVASGK